MEWGKVSVFKIRWYAFEINMWTACSFRVVCYLHPFVCVVTMGGLSKLQWTGDTHETKHKCNSNRQKCKSGAKKQKKQKKQKKKTNQVI